MLRSVRSNQLPSLDAVFEVHAALQVGLRVHATHARRMIGDDALLLRAFDRLGRDRAVVTVVLEGRALVRVGEARGWVGPGETFLLTTKRALAMRFEATPTYRSLVVEADSGDLGERLVIEQASGLLPLAEPLWQQLREPTADVTAPLRAYLERVPLPAPALLEEEVPANLAALSAALDAQLSDLSSQPMVVDLERQLGRSARQLSRLVRELNTRYGFNADGWIDTRNRRRLMLAAALLSDPARRVAEVAQAVGYTSPQVMSRAFALAGLPAPREVAAAVCALGLR